VEIFIWVAAVIAVVVVLIALNDFFGAGRARRALLRKPSHDRREHARIQTEGQRRKDDIGGGLGGGG
jgi:hypothetical protein